MTARALLVASAGLLVLAGLGGVLSAQNKPATQCALTGKGTFDLGWVETQQSQRFRCVATFDPSLQRTGVAWVRIDADGKVQVP
jgi:hypothetical protein